MCNSAKRNVMRHSCTPIILPMLIPESAAVTVTIPFVSHASHATERPSDSCRYGFLLFNSHNAANFVLTQLNGKLIPGEEPHPLPLRF